ncbi:G protein-coupled receptor [Caenorhabditis elegans]|uniref:G protein-coupled receptor n=1 Tax=Caenorhabditis elegans TaxID=6239 RepID=Q18611_CAEEL|nr:G protein-coupled receptor [Caenorhabditis elegans]CCD63969.1 G protein-coupled receptor [Caenorhabditis elegans]|eukprot:NP_508189.2 Uncharacterized protein CELE_C44C1.1 [Caenorhabditis elegans]
MGVVNLALTFDAVFAAVSGLALYFFPGKFGDLCFQKETDGVHWHLIRCIGGQIFASCLVSLKFRGSSQTSQSVCHFIRLIPSILILMLVLQIQSVTPNLVEPTILKFFKYLMISTITLHVTLLSFAGWKTGTRLLPGNRFGNFLYQLDALASICIGTTWMTFPKWLLHRQVLVELDESHEFLGRVMGANFIASYIVSTHVLHWESEQDRNVAVDGRVICCISILGAQIWSQTYAHWSGNHWVGISLFSTWTVISLIYRSYLVCTKKSHNKKE